MREREDNGEISEKRNALIEQREREELKERRGGNINRLSVRGSSEEDMKWMSEHKQTD